MKDKNKNIVKQVCKELGITQKELAERIGYKYETINKAASTGKISRPVLRAIELLIETEKLKEKIKEYEEIKTALKKLLSD